MNGHRSDLRVKPNLPLSRHLLRSPGHSAEDFHKLKNTLIDHDLTWDDKTRQQKERYWIIKLKSLFPRGINEKCQYNLQFPYISAFLLTFSAKMFSF